MQANSGSALHSDARIRYLHKRGKDIIYKTKYRFIQIDYFSQRVWHHVCA